MARQGGFGGGLNPFGGGTLGSLAQYDIGADLADLTVYTTEVAWGNGLATDDDYIAALRTAVDATDPDTQRRASAQNKLDDALYRIGRSRAEAGGLDSLIAYDQAALAGMTPDSVRYRDVQDSLESEMGQRRSRDYGLLVTAYNDGDLPTATLLAWVQHTLGTIPADSPDYDNWTNVQADLTDRIQGERDTTVFQDFQRGRMTSQEYLAYLTTRRDGYSPNTPKYQEWANRLEDATIQVKEEAQAKKDADFFNRYEEGKVSDQTYLKYLRNRIDGMAPDDAQRGEWQHRLNQATFSLAEDKLRFDAERASSKVSNAKRPTSSDIRAAQSTATKLLDFYRSYRGTLNPASAEWRDVTRSMDVLTRNLASLTPSSGGSAGGSSGSSGASSGGTSAAPGSAVGAGPAAAGGKVISPKYSLSNILGLFSINPTANKKAVSAAKKYLDLNMATLNNALTRGDGYWLFQDPRNPGATVAARDPNGDLVLDAKGKPVMVRGSAYLKVSSEAYSNLKTVEASNFMATAELSLAKGKYGDYAYNLRRAGETLDQARLQDAQYRAQNWEDWYKATEVAVDKLTMAGDYAGAMRVATDLASRLAREEQNPYLDDTRRSRLDEIGQKLADNKIMPKADPETGAVLYEGAVNLAELSRGNLVLNPGWHHVLKSNDRGQPAWGPVFDAKQDGTWEAKHVTVHTTLGDKVVTGEAVLSDSPLAPTVRVRTPDGYQSIDFPGATSMLSFVDEHGRVQRAYSIDGGRTWIRPAAGMPAPTIEIAAELTKQTDEKGSVSYVDATTGDIVIQQTAKGWAVAPGYATWYGQSAWEAAKAIPVGKQHLRSDDPRERRLLNAADAARMDMGGPGQHMTLATASPSGIVNLVPSNFATEAQLAARKAKAAGSKGYTPRPSEMADLQAEKASRRSLAANDWQPPEPRTAGGYWGAEPVTGTGEMAAMRAEQASARALRPVTAYDIAVQLPADTPPRYDGYTNRPPTIAAKAGPSRALPALVAPPRAVVPALRPVTPIYPAAKTAILKGSPPPAIKKAPAPPPTVAAKKGTTTAAKPAPKPAPKLAPKPPTYSTSKTNLLKNL